MSMLPLGFVGTSYSNGAVHSVSTSSCNYRSNSVTVNRNRRSVLKMEAEVETEEKESVASAESFSGCTSEMKSVIDIEGIMKILPHRYPFLLVDKVIHFEPGKRAIGTKNVSMNEPQFTGHFPDRPIMPGVLMIEAMAQVGGIVMLQEPVTDGKGEFFFAGVDNVRWRKVVVPGDTLVMEMELTAFKKRFGVGKMTGKAFVDGVIAVEGDFTFAYNAAK